MLVAIIEPVVFLTVKNTRRALPVSMNPALEGLELIRLFFLSLDEQFVVGEDLGVKCLRSFCVMLVRRLAGALSDVAPRPFPETGRDLLQSADRVRLIVPQQVIVQIVSIQLRLVKHRASLARRPWSPVWCVRVEVETIFFHKFPKLCSPDGEARFESVRQSVSPHALGIEVPQVVMTPLDAEVDQRSQSLAWMARWNLSISFFFSAGLSRSYHDDG